jgi:signal transduction histidine kinase
LYEDKEYVRKFGDLILWKEIIEKSNSDNLKYVVLVTGDVKEDWWFEKRGKKLGPRIELLNEIYSEVLSLDTFYMYDTSSFLQYAKKELEINVKESSISETKQLIELSRQTRLEIEEGQIYLPDFLKQIAMRFPNLKIGIGNSVKQLSLLSIDIQSISLALMEIFNNVINHSPDGYVGIQARVNENIIAIRFKNIKPKENQGSTQTEIYGRGNGIEYIKATLSKEGIDSHFGEDKKRFWVEIFIPIKPLPNTSFTSDGLSWNV